MRTAILGTLFLLLLPLLPADTPYVSPVARAAAPHRFSLEGWILQNVSTKWLYQLRQLLPGQDPAPMERQEAVEAYFRLGNEAIRVQRELTRLTAQRGTGNEENPLDRSLEAELERQETHFAQLTRRRDDLRPLVEDTVERELSAVLKEQGLRWRAGPFKLLFPPVDLRLDRTPKLLAVSLRGRIELTTTHVLKGDLILGEQQDLEEQLLQEEDLAALVVNLAGIATYPALISSTQTLRPLLYTAAHEWLHQYWFFRPLGRSYGTTAEMTTLNETAADVAGRELGDRIFQRLGIEAPLLPAQEPPNETFDFDREMHETRLRVDALLAHGQVEEAESYMEERRRLLAENGYYIRKLNQAFFAFHGTYAESPTSISPIADQLLEMRRSSPTVGSFVRTMASFGNYQEFLEYLKEVRSDSSANIS